LRVAGEGLIDLLVGGPGRGVVQARKTGADHQIGPSGIRPEKTKTRLFWKSLVSNANFEND
jgi:hypothetical protein